MSSNVAVLVIISSCFWSMGACQTATVIEVPIARSPVQPETPGSIPVTRWRDSSCPVQANSWSSTRREIPVRADSNQLVKIRFTRAAVAIEPGGRVGPEPFPLTCQFLFPSFERVVCGWCCLLLGEFQRRCRCIRFCCSCVVVFTSRSRRRRPFSASSNRVSPSLRRRAPPTRPPPLTTAPDSTTPVSTNAFAIIDSIRPANNGLWQSNFASFQTARVKKK